MKFAKKVSFLLTIAAALTYSANALDAQAKFTLAHDAYVGSQVLPAGEYIVTMSEEGTTKAFITPVERSGVSMIALPVTTDDYATCKQSSLTMQVVGAAWSVSSICFAEPQVALHFPVIEVKTTAAAAPPVTAGIR
jgi:hypothetical protein